MLQLVVRILIALLVFYLLIGLILAWHLGYLDGDHSRRAAKTVIYWLWRHHDRHVVRHFFNHL